MRRLGGGGRGSSKREKHAARAIYAAWRRRRGRARIGVILIVNDRADIALAARAGGVHLGQDDLDPTAARRLLGDDFIIGYSTHSLEQARAAALLPVDYIAFGPVFPTRTKENPDPTVGLEALSRVPTPSSRPSLGASAHPRETAGGLMPGPTRRV